ncbi:hypothetical protein ACROYT_G033453 [Oculina patagonica]
MEERFKLRMVSKSWSNLMFHPAILQHIVFKTSLRVHGRVVNDDGLRLVFDNATIVKSLTLYQNIEVTGGALISAAREGKFKALKKLSVARTLFGLDVIVEILKETRSLEHLDIMDNDYPDEFCDYALQFASHSLKYLRLAVEAIWRKGKVESLLDACSTLKCLAIPGDILSESDLFSLLSGRKWKNIRKVEINYLSQEYIERIVRGMSSTSLHVPPELCLCDTKVDARVKEMFKAMNITSGPPINSATAWRKRGSGECRNCGASYSNRYKPADCPACGTHLGGSIKSPTTKKIRKDVPMCVLIYDAGSTCIYSVNSSVRDDRCLVTTEGGARVCSQEQCKQNRAVYLTSGNDKPFTCKHIEQIVHAESSRFSVEMDESMILAYPSDLETKNALRNCLRPGFPSVIEVSEKNYAVYAHPTATNPLGFCHVKKLEGGKFLCSSKECRKPSGNTKTTKTRQFCTHINIICCVLRDKTPSSCGSSTSTTSTSGTEQLVAEEALPPKPEEKASSKTSSISRASTITLNANRALPYKKPNHILRRSNEMESKTYLQVEGGFPDLFQPVETVCGLCTSNLNAPRSHSGGKGEGYIICDLVPFKRVQVRVRYCSNRQCQAMHQPSLYEYGLFNVSDKALIAYSILLEWRAGFKRGMPINLLIESKLEVLGKKAGEDCPKREELIYLRDLLYNGFYCFEIMAERNLDDVICGICGTIGVLYLGDGNQKNCCTSQKINYTASQSSGQQNEMVSLKQFVTNMKKHWIEKTIYTRVNETVSYTVSEIPPIIAPMLAGKVVNTEPEKKSVYLKDKKEGDVAVLHKMIVGKEFNMRTLQQNSVDNLKEICRKCGITTSGKSKDGMCASLQELYASLLAGKSPCHEFTKVPGHTGGFYHIVCRHGCTVASKFLLLQESVRDVADLYLSLKYPPVVFINDTPCGLARHIDIRSPCVAEILWGNKSACFEEPKLGKEPCQVSIPEIVPGEYRPAKIHIYKPEAEDNSWMHPLTGNARRYIMGDRFHASVNPHKSPLCAFHDINLCAQGNSMKTSYQESENHRKNALRLRSSCMQSFSVHFLYNFLMDYYQNEKIVELQRAQILKSLVSEGEKVVRDEYCRFIIVQSDPK